MSQQEECRVPMEFWITQIGDDHVSTLKPNEEEIALGGYVHVREVLPDEPNYRDLAEKLEEALEKISGEHSCMACVQNMAIADQSLATYREAVKR